MDYNKIPVSGASNGYNKKEKRRETQTLSKGFLVVYVEPINVK